MRRQMMTSGAGRSSHERVCAASQRDNSLTHHIRNAPGQGGAIRLK
jgi:hypothetical protein